MNVMLSFIRGGIFFFLLMAGYMATAQDFKKSNPGMNKVLVDTTLLRATEVIIKPGQKSTMHTHPAHFFYALTDGKLIVHYKDGKTETIDVKAGESGFSDPERPHYTENGGTKTIKFLLVELKEHPYRAPKK